jgi:hypothetical protein
MNFLWIAALSFTPGAVFNSKINVPIPRVNQKIDLIIINNTRARIEIEGFLSVSGYVDFKMSPPDKLEYMHLDDGLSRFMRRYGSKISNVTYNKEKQEASLTLEIKPILYKKRITMRRKKKRYLASLGFSTFPT